MAVVSYANVRLVRRLPVVVHVLLSGVLGVLAFLASVALVWRFVLPLFAPAASSALLLGYLIALVALMSIAQISRVTVGADGIRAMRAFRKAVFIPYGSIARVDRSTFWMRPCVSLSLRDGGALDLVWNGRVDRSSERDDVARLLQANVKAHVASANPAAEALFARSEAVGDWVRRVRGMSHEASYRGVTPEMLWELVENPAAAPTARAGAAAALAKSIDDEGRARIRVAAEACAEPRLRVALEAATAVDEDDEVLTRALGRLE